MTVGLVAQPPLANPSTPAILNTYKGNHPLQAMINLIDELTIYEVIFASYDEDGNYKECVDDTTIISPSYLSPQDVIEEAILRGEIDPENRLVQVYEARSATINIHKANIELADYDTSTGISGSPIYEVYYDYAGNKITDV